jgi:hypothetical protein
MRRIWFAVLGALEAVAGVAFVWAFGLGAGPLSGYAALGSLWFGAAVMYLLGGLGATVGGFEWYQLVGLGHVCLGLQMAVRVPFEVADGTGGASLVVAVGAGLGGLALAYIGVDWIRGAPNFDLSSFDGGPSADPE